MKDVDATVYPHGFAPETVQPSLVADRIQVLDKTGEYLVRVCFVEVDESDTFGSCVNACDDALNIDFLASVFGSLRRLDRVDRQRCRSHRKENGENQKDAERIADGYFIFQ